MLGFVPQYNLQFIATTASAGELMAFNALTAEALTKSAIALVH
ncbi:hypothetical protein [Nostoc sp.]